MKLVKITLYRYLGFRKTFTIDLGDDITEAKIDNMLNSFYETHERYIEFHPLGKKSFCVNKYNVSHIQYQILDVSFEINVNK